ncbi:MAG: hypothetical protein ABI947_21940 [Chloroflexota bacterium]
MKKSLVTIIQRIGLIALLLVFAFASTAPVQAQPRVGMTYTVINTNNSGTGSLRQAIQDANTTTDLDTINFNIPGTGVQTISPTSALPPISFPVIIDGATQPNYAGTPLIELDGHNLSGSPVGLAISGGGSTVRGLTINRFCGVEIQLYVSGANTITGNYIGTNSAGNARFFCNGTDASANGNGININSGSTVNTIGGTTAAARNVISGNLAGILVSGASNTIQGNYIGINAAGTAALSNYSSGVQISSANTNTVGGATAGARNVISGHANNNGVLIQGSSTGNKIQGNYIGTNAAGTASITNYIGVKITNGTSNTIGGATAGLGNLVSGNNYGVVITNNAVTNIVKGNFIGVDVTGTVALPNNTTGIYIWAGANHNTIGGTTAAERNIVSGNKITGIALSDIGGTGTDYNIVQGNYVGTDITGTKAIPNSNSGFFIDSGSSNNIIGGTAAGAGNIIAFNSGDGLTLVGSSLNNKILSNSIFSNTGKGIALTSGGSNLSQPAPVFTSVSKVNTNVNIAATLTAAASAIFRIEFFRNISCDSSGSGEGRYFLGTVDVMTDGTGVATINASLPISVSRFVITATATDPTGNTSAFSQCSAAIGIPKDTIGIFRPSTNTFYMRNSNTTGSADLSSTFGLSTDFPVVGDWNGDGISTIGVYRPSTAFFYLKNSNSPGAPVAYSFQLGYPNDMPMAGDWDGDGTDGVGVFRPSNGLIYLKNDLVTGYAQFQMVLGIPGDVPIAGDWDGDGIAGPGVFRPSTANFYLSNKVCNCSVFADYQIALGAGGDQPMAGDWNGNGISGIGVFRPSNGQMYLKYNPTAGYADISLIFGIPNDKPVAGQWVLPPGDQELPPQSATTEPVSPPAPKLAPTFVP